MCSIAKYNDLVRQAIIDPVVKRLLDDEGCRFRVYITAALQHTIKNQDDLIRAIAHFDQFNEQNDPHGEHDFVIFKFEDEWINAKFDYYAPDLEHGSEDPEDLSKTVRVLTIMLASDY